jgi:hypothetical protein
MTAMPAAAWFADRTEGAPPVLRQRAEQYFAAADGANLAHRLGGAAEVALARAIDAGSGRPAALDLLAADALITLALLAQAETDPAELGSCAATMRARMAPTS